MDDAAGGAVEVAQAIEDLAGNGPALLLWQHMMALKMEVQVTSLTQLQHCGKGAAVQLKDVQQCYNLGVPA